MSWKQVILTSVLWVISGALIIFGNASPNQVLPVTIVATIGIFIFGQDF